MADAERRVAIKTFTNEQRDRQQRFPFTIYRLPEVSAALEELFHGKCAYCEVHFLPTSLIGVEHFRPKSSVTESPEHPGYWWLASDWENLLISCHKCNMSSIETGERTGKGNRFPLDNEAERGFNPGEESREQPLLLNPCVDAPELHLVFEETGRVVSDTLRGQASITVLGLNRVALVEARRSAAARVRSTIGFIESLQMDNESLKLDNNPPARDIVRRFLAELRMMTEDSQEFAGLKRQLVRPVFDRFIAEGLIDPVPWLSTPGITTSRKVRARSSFHLHEVKQSSFSLADEKGRERYRSERRIIEHITIRNVKAIRNLDLELGNPGSGRTPWLMLLGENGTGKSTILQAIALTLVGAAGMARLGQMRAVNPADYVRYRCKSGTVSVKLTGFVGPHRLTFHRDRVEFKSPTGERTVVLFSSSGPSIQGEGWTPQTVLLGYGATRLLPRTSDVSLSLTGDVYSRVDNLFDPFVPLFNAESWLAGLVPVQFDSAALVLKDLLTLGSNASLRVEQGRVLVVNHGDTVPLRQVSDGYQSVVATAIDILEVVMRLWPNVEDAEGIVLLDEIGAHLHPTWKMRIVGSIRRAVPGIQFITSTHDPLCLRGLEAGEVVVMQRDDDEKVMTLNDLPSPGDFRIDQLLTSDFFGLNSTDDPETAALFDEYYALLALREPTADQSQLIAMLQNELKDRQYLGTTLREMLMNAAVDRIVARHRHNPGATTIQDLKQQAINEVTSIWAEDESRLAQP
jgi:uncharacterized protein (TIGR02646 family)